MTRFFIADPALRDHRGHHCNLTLVISDALIQRGHETVWLTGTDFKLYADEEPKYSVRQSFSASTYDGHRATKAAHSNGTNAAATEEVRSVKERLRSIYRKLPESQRRRLTPAINRAIGVARSMKRTSPSTPGDIVQPAKEKLRPEQEIYRALKAFDCSSEDRVLFHTSDAHTYRDVVQFFSSLAHVTEWNNFPIFHLSTPYDESVMPHNNSQPNARRSVRRLNNLGLLGKRVMLHAENALLADHLSAEFDADVTTLPIPPFEFDNSDQAQQDDALNIVYLGAARTEKGFTALPALVISILKIRPALNVRFHIQVTPQILGYTPDVLNAVNELKEIDDARLTLIDSTLSVEAYRSMLRLADVMILLYDPQRYRVRSSGLAVEAILSCATIITSTDTFPAHIGGPSAISLGPGQNPSEAIIEILRNRSHFVKLARERRDWYLRNHSLDAFVETMTGRKGERIRDFILPGTHRYEENTPWIPLLGGQNLNLGN